MQKRGLKREMHWRPQTTDEPDYKNKRSLNSKKLLAAFLFDTIGANRKAWQKRNAIRKISRSAERDKGSAILTAPPFEKGVRKIFYMTMRCHHPLKNFIKRETPLQI